MEYFIKSEPVENEEHLINECLLCEDGKKYYDLLVQHFQQQHSGNY